ncbi:T9SS type A sorting domain-containing protein [Flexithrix dorotheae]|uniref:T9SS type A sorting domain-containing protein n=1 Tax=Flexithrix dorotheae TaxID=70993 RepID=UPI00036CED0A|nr:T9SS type A sorting domain-containing protein [Flexithrix dorotheae]
MKKYFASVLLLLVFALNLSASDSPSSRSHVSLKALESNSALLSIFNYANSDVAVKIKTRDGNVILAKEFSSESVLLRKLDLSGLDKGTYLLNVVIENREILQKFAIDAEGAVSVDPNQVVDYFLPRVKQEEAKLHVSFQNLMENYVETTILDENGEEVYSNGYAADSFAKTFNLSNLAPGKYTFYLSSGSKSYNTEVVLK